jgi:type I restriction enzyme R subunit
MDMKGLSESDICMKFINPAIEAAGWDLQSQVRRELTFTDGKIIVRGKLWKRGKRKRADYVLYWMKNLPIAVIEAKDNKHTIASGMQQALGYADCLDVPFVFSSNGDGFQFHDRTGLGDDTESTLGMDAFPSPEFLWERYRKWKGLEDAPIPEVVTEPYHEDATGKEPRYYQRVAINRALEAVARGQDRILLVMATGTGKTYTAFQIIWRLWKGGHKKRILFLTDRNILVDQTKINDFKPFGAAMTKVQHRNVDKSYEIYLALYQTVSGTEEEANIYKQFSPDFFDLIVVDECSGRFSGGFDELRQAILYPRSACGRSETAPNHLPKNTPLPNSRAPSSLL